MKRSIIRSALPAAAAFAMVMAITSHAVASPSCTSAPRSKWLTEAQMKAKIAKMGYQKIKVFQVTGSCYEIYAHTKDGRRAEVYFNPVSGAVVQNNVD